MVQRHPSCAPTSNPLRGGVGSWIRGARTRLWQLGPPEGLSEWEAISHNPLSDLVLKDALVPQPALRKVTASWPVDSGHIPLKLPHAARHLR